MNGAQINGPDWYTILIQYVYDTNEHTVSTSSGIPGQLVITQNGTEPELRNLGFFADRAGVDLECGGKPALCGQGATCRVRLQ